MCDCLNPTFAWRIGKMRCKDGVESDRITFSEREATEYFAARFGSEVARLMMPKFAFAVRCGKCLNCQAKKRKDWSTRLVHEASMHDRACMITLTYDENHVPLTDDIPFTTNAEKHFWRFGQMQYALGTPTLNVRDVQLFLKRLRRQLEYHGLGGHFRYFVCGEYGKKNHRPHYHIIIFGWDDPQKVYFFQRGSHVIYRSSIVEKCWTLGYSTMTDMAPALAKYCARYVTKKMVGNPPPDFIVPEFILQSRRGGGIGALWLQKWKYNLVHGLLTYKVGQRIIKVQTPDYYMHWLRKHDLDLWCFIRDNKIDWIERHNVVNVKPVEWSDLARKAEHYYLQLEHEKEKDET